MKNTPPKPTENTSENETINIMVCLIGETLSNNYNNNGLNVSFTTYI